MFPSSHLPRCLAGIAIFALMGVLVMSRSREREAEVGTPALRLQKTNASIHFEIRGTLCPSSLPVSLASATSTPTPSRQPQRSASSSAAAVSKNKPARSPAQVKRPSYEEFLRKPKQRMSEDAHLRQQMPAGIPPVSSAVYPKHCARLHGGTATQVKPTDPGTHFVWNASRSSDHAIVTLAAGDMAARGAVALLQSLRDVGTCPGIDVWVLIMGGLPSYDCLHNETLTEPAFRNQLCEADHPGQKVFAVSQVYLDAIHALGGRTAIIPYLKSSTAVIPGGRHGGWGLSFNKLRVFGMAQYRSVLSLDSDILVLQNLDHLLFYPDFTSAFTQDCCNRAAQPRPSGGFWVLQPSAARMAQIEIMVNGPDPLVPLNLEMGPEEHWHFSDMSVVTVLFLEVRKVPPYYHMPEAMDARVAHDDIQHWYTEAGIQNRVARWEAAEANGSLVLGSAADLATFPGKPEHLGEYEFVVSNKNPNLGDKIAFDMGHPEIAGRRWHMLNESYDVLAIECQCMQERELGPLKYSLHFSCLPSPIEKPSSYETRAALEQALASPPAEMQPCMATIYRSWLKVYDRGLAARGRVQAGKLAPDVWLQRWRVRRELQAVTGVDGWLSTTQRPPWTSMDSWAAANTTAAP